MQVILKITINEFKSINKFQNQIDISPSSSCYHETLSTLLFAQRAKKIVNKPKINEVVKYFNSNFFDKFIMILLSK